MILLRHRLANWFLLQVCRLHRYVHVRWLPRAGVAIGRFIHGPLDPARLYCKRPVRVLSLPRAAPITSAQPDVSGPGSSPEGTSELEQWLMEEAKCEQ